MGVQGGGWACFVLVSVGASGEIVRQADRQPDNQTGTQSTQTETEPIRHIHTQPATPPPTENQERTTNLSTTTMGDSVLKATAMPFQIINAVDTTVSKFSSW